MEERKLDMAVTAFNTTPDGTLEFDSGKVKNLDTKTFGQMFLEEQFINKSERNSISNMNRSSFEDRGR